MGYLNLLKQINKYLPRKAIFEKFKPNASDRKLFDEQINRFSIFADIAQIEPVEDKDLDEIVIQNEFKEKLKRKFLSLKRKR